MDKFLVHMARKPPITQRPKDETKRSKQAIVIGFTHLRTSIKVSKWSSWWAA